MGEGSGAGEESRIVRTQPRRVRAVSLATSECDPVLQFARSRGTDPRSPTNDLVWLITMIDSDGASMPLIGNASTNGFLV
jgi:hypothetical protein